MNILIKLLTQIKTFELTAEDFLAINNYTGNGNVEITHKENTVTLISNGKWKDMHNTVRSFTFSYRFIFDSSSNEISIEHLRYGENNGVFLCKLKQTNNHYYSSIEPHICNKDKYSAVLYFSDDSLRLDWKITGPNKNMFLEYIFNNQPTIKYKEC